MRGTLRMLVWGLIITISWGVYQNINATDKSRDTTKQNKIKEFVTIDEKVEVDKALTYLNNIRDNAGMVRLDQHQQLEKSAKNHANYLITHDIIGHDESSSRSGFTGTKASDRAMKVGYKSSLVSENISSMQENYKESVDELFSAIYHRFGFLDFRIDEIGIAVTQNSNNKSKITFVYNMGIGPLQRICSQKSFEGRGKYVYNICADKNFKIKESHFNKAIDSNKIHNKKIIVYPYDEQSDVPPVFFDEIPDPLPRHDVSGFPISISFNKAYFKRVKIESFKLFDSNNQQIEDTIKYDEHSDPHQKFKKFEYALFPLKRLEWGSRYRVEVKFTADGQKREKVWHFTTRRFNEPIHKVIPTAQKYTLTLYQPTLFYFPPLSPRDIPKKIEYPETLDVAFVDQNTIKVVAKESWGDWLELKFGEHRLKLKVE